MGLHNHSCKAVTAYPPEELQKHAGLVHTPPRLRLACQMHLKAPAKTDMTSSYDVRGAWSSCQLHSIDRPHLACRDQQQRQEDK